MSDLNVTEGEWVADNDGSGYISSGDRGLAIAVFDSDALLMAQSKNMYEMIEYLLNNDLISDGAVRKECQILLAKCRGEQ